MTLTREQFIKRIKFDALLDIEKGRAARDYTIRVTSGTTNSIPVMLVRERHSSQAVHSSFEGFKRLIIAPGSLSARLFHMSEFLFYYPTRSEKILSLDNSDIGPSLGRIIEDFQPDTFYAPPSFIARTLEYVTDRKVLSKITTLKLTGEILTKTTTEFFKKRLPQARIIMRYSATEVGTISTPYCSYLPINQYHPQKNITIEIVNTDDDDIGEILISKKIGSSVELKQYAIGDIGRFISTPCPCGDPITFEILGRKDFDFIRLVGAILRQEEFDRVAAILSPYIEDYRISAQEIVHGEKLFGKIIIQVIPTKKLLKMADPKVFLQQDISKNIFLTSTQTLEELIKKNIFFPPVIEFVESFLSQHRIVKLKKL